MPDRRLEILLPGLARCCAAVVPATGRASVFAALMLSVVAFGGAAVAQGEEVRSLAGSYLAARSAVLAGDHREAAEYFDRAMQADPNNMLLIGNAIFSNASLGNWDRAAEIAALMPREPGRNADLADLVLLVDALRNGDLATARASIEEGYGAGPFIDALALGWIALGEGDMTRAEDAFASLTLDRGLAELAWMHMAFARAAVGDFETAYEILSDGRVGQMENTPRALRAQAEILVQLDRRGDALDLLDGFTRAVPDPALLALQGRIGAGAEGPYDFVTTAQEGLAEVFLSVADALGVDSDSSLPLIYARAANVIYSELHTAAVLSGDILLQNEQLDLAAEAFAAVPETSDEYIAAQMRLADVLEDLGRVDDAVATLSTLLESRPDLAVVHGALGDVLRRNQRYDEAILAYDEMLERVDSNEPRYWFIYYARAISHHQTDNWPPAEADFRRALELNPDQPNVLNYLGYSLVEQRRSLDEALDMIERAVAARPDSGFIVDSLGWVYYRLGRFDEAVAPLERAVELEATDPIINDHLGDAYWIVGREREAQFQWERALSFEPEEADAERIRFKLEVGLDAVLQMEGGVGESQ